MIVNAWGVVLARRVHGEADRLCTIYTESFGKLTVRFVGVDKPGRKLKALSEPMVWGEYRLYLSPKSEFAKAIGGRLIGTFPRIREDFDRTVSALGCCEMLSMLTPERAPNAEKYALICSALACLELGESRWLTLAFGLRLLRLAGYGLESEFAASQPAAWAALHEAPLESLRDEPWRPEAAAKLREAMLDQYESIAGRALRSRQFLQKLDPQEAVR